MQISFNIPPWKSLSLLPCLEPWCCERTTQPTCMHNSLVPHVMMILSTHTFTKYMASTFDISRGFTTATPCNADFDSCVQFSSNIIRRRKVHLNSKCCFWACMGSAWNSRDYPWPSIHLGYGFYLFHCDEFLRFQSWFSILRPFHLSCVLTKGVSEWMDE